MNAIVLYRFSNYLFRHGIPLVPKIIYYITFLIYNSSIPYKATIGKGTVFGYGGMGVVIHESAVIGSNCMIGQQVTIGGRSGHLEVPIIGDNCMIGAGARVLGPIRIGNNVDIGANSVVLTDIPSHSVIAGIPAVIKRNKNDFK